MAAMKRASLAGSPDHSPSRFAPARRTVFSAVLGGLLTMGAGAVAWEAVQRVWAPEPVPGLTLVVVAAIGVVIRR